MKSTKIVGGQQTPATSLSSAPASTERKYIVYVLLSSIWIFLNTLQIHNVDAHTWRIQPYQHVCMYTQLLWTCYRLENKFWIRAFLWDRNVNPIEHVPLCDLNWQLIAIWISICLKNIIGYCQWRVSFHCSYNCHIIHNMMTSWMKQSLWCTILIWYFVYTHLIIF